MWRWDKNNSVIKKKKKKGTFVGKGKNSFIFLIFFLKEEVVLVLDN